MQASKQAMVVLLGPCWRWRCYWWWGDGHWVRLLTVEGPRGRGVAERGRAQELRPYLRKLAQRARCRACCGCATAAAISAAARRLFASNHCA